MAHASGGADAVRLSGVGRICFKGEKPQALNPGDTVMIPPGVLHWHGAAPDRLFAHMAMSENGDDGSGTAWGEHVSDADYTAPVRVITRRRRASVPRVRRTP